MVIFNTVEVDGLIVRTAWDEYHIGPVELLITVDNAPAGKGIPDRFIHRLSLQSMTPDTIRTVGSLRVVGDWLEKNKPQFRKRPTDSPLFYASVALFFTLVVQEGGKGVCNTLANYTGVRPSMARLWIDQARKRGMLTDNKAKNTAGRACGILTDKAREILTRHDESVSHSEAA